MWIQLLAVVICSLPWVRVVTNNISSSTSALCPTRPPSFSAINLPFFPLPLSDLSFPSPKATFLGLELTPADESGPWRSKRSLDLPKQQYLSANQPTTSESYKGMRRLNSYIYMLPEVGYMILLIRQKRVFIASPYNVKMAGNCAENEGAWF